MKKRHCGVAISSAFLTMAAGAANVYVMSGGDATTDAAVVAALTSQGHTATLGVQYINFDGTQSLAGFETVYLQANFNWSSGAMPAAGQQALVNYVNGGGRLVTSEWVVWKVAAQQSFVQLAPIFPASPATSYTTTTTETLTQVTADAVINAGVPAQLTFPVDNFAGTETMMGAQAGATVYYGSAAGSGVVGLCGWRVGAGSVFNFSTTCGPTQVADVNFGRLFANVMGAGATGGCYANCDNSTSTPMLNVNDFNCFLNRFAAGESWANCDASTSAPVLNVNDFQCFLNRFAAGCG